MKLQFRDYQKECLTAIFEASKADIEKPLVSLPTGTGKAIIFAYIIKKISERGGRSLVLVHRDELLNQAEDMDCSETSYTDLRILILENHIVP